jgi:type II secretory pathway pseudopilin PulG
MQNGDRHQQGYTYLLMLFVVAALGTSLALLGETWRTATKREQRAELTFMLEAYGQALASYRRGTPDGSSYLPGRLQELLEDTRTGVRRRHLRRLYPNPLSGKADWILVRDELGIVGVCVPGTPRICSADVAP